MSLVGAAMKRPVTVLVVVVAIMENGKVFAGMVFLFPDGRSGFKAARSPATH